ncbi:PIP5K1 [Symbiodinium microadriaticum]|nr:PIP5K1 [Symbiodinium microadriaticum]
MHVLMELPGGTRSLLEADRLATGIGILRHTNGSFYDGQWSAGQATGFGRFKHADWVTAMVSIGHFLVRSSQL